MARVLGMLQTLPEPARQAIVASLPAADRARAAELAAAAEAAPAPAPEPDRAEVPPRTDQPQAERPAETHETLADRLLGRRRRARGEE